MIKKFVLIAVLAYGAVYGLGGGPEAIRKALIGTGRSGADYATGAAYTGA